MINCKYQYVNLLNLHVFKLIFLIGLQTYQISGNLLWFSGFLDRVLQSSFVWDLLEFRIFSSRESLLLVTGTNEQNVFRIVYFVAT